MEASVIERIRAKLDDEDDGDDANIAPADASWVRRLRATSVSPVGGCIVIASSKSVFVLSSKSNGVGGSTIALRSVTDFEDDTVNCVLCVPVGGSGGTTSSSPPWHCALVAFRSGLFAVVSDAGDVLVRRQCLDGPVMAIRTSDGAHLVRRRAHHTDSALVSPISEVLVVYDKTLVSISATHLLNVIHSNKSKLAQMKARGEPLPASALSSLPCKRLHLRDQAMARDASALTVPNTAFKRMAQLSMSERINEAHLRSLPNLTLLPTVGSSPFYQFNTPYNVQQQQLSELAENMVSTVKSGIFRVASGMLWGAAATEPAEEKEPEQKLAVAHAFKDSLKVGNRMEKSPDSLHIAIVDSQNRVLVLDSHLGTVLHVWKGYHHAEIGWVLSQSEAGDKVCCLLAIYLPRRGLLEVWAVEQKRRVAAFSVSKFGCLVTSSDCILDNVSAVQKAGMGLFSRSVSTCFLAPDGAVMNIVVPFAFITRQSSATHDDLDMQRKLQEILESDGLDESVLLATLKAAKTASGMAVMLVDAASKCRLPTPTLRSVFEGCDRELEARDLAPNNATRQLLQSLLRILELFEFLSKSSLESDSPPAGDVDVASVRTAFSCDKAEAETLTGMLKRIAEAQLAEPDEPALEVGLLVRCFLGAFSPSNISASLRPCNFEAVLVRSLCVSSRGDAEATAQVLSSCGLQPQEVLQAVLHFCGQKANGGAVARLAHRLEAFFNVTYDLAAKSQGGSAALYHQGRKVLHGSVLSPALYLVLFAWSRSVATSPSLGHFKADARRSLHLVEAFVAIQRAYDSLAGARASQVLANCSVDSAFQAGNGRIPELLAQALVQLQLLPKDLTSEECSSFLEKCAKFFPKSVETHTIVSHMTWDYFQRWNSSRPRLELLRRGLACLRHACNGSFHLGHSLALLITRTFLGRLIRDAVNLTEIPSSTRCQREIGIPESDLVLVLEICTDVMRVVVESADEMVDGGISLGLYDEVSSVPKQHLLDHVRAQATSNTADSFSDRLALQYQFSTAAFAIRRFDLSVKPLKLFSNQESNVFFQSESSAVINLLASTHNHKVRDYRNRFMESACEAAVQCIHTLPTGELETTEFKLWCGHLSLLAKMWFKADKLRQDVILALYRAGFDSLGHEMLLASSDQTTLAEKLMHDVVIARISKVVYESKDHNRKVALVKPDIMSMLSQAELKAARLPETSLTATKDLLVSLCNSGLADGSMQLAYECLSLVQIFMKHEAN